MADEQSIEDLNSRLDGLESQISSLAGQLALIATAEEADWEGPIEDEEEGPFLVGNDQVAVDEDAVPGFLGAESTDGVLRTDSTMTYADGGDFVTLGGKYSSTPGDPGPPGDGLPTGQYVGQVLWWNGTNWIMSNQPTTPAVLVFNGTTVQWVQAGTDYQVLQRKADDTLGFDWTRAHA